MFAGRDSSISFIIVAMGLPARAANACRASMNSGSSVMLVWWPDKDTDSFFIWFYLLCYSFPAIKQSVNARCASS